MTYDDAMNLAVALTIRLKRGEIALPDWSREICRIAEAMGPDFGMKAREV